MAVLLIQPMGCNSDFKVLLNSDRQDDGSVNPDGPDTVPDDDDNTPTDDDDTPVDDDDTPTDDDDTPVDDDDTPTDDDDTPVDDDDTPVDDDDELSSIYWTDFSGRISVIKSDLTAQTVLAERGSAVLDMDIDTVNSRIYWIELVDTDYDDAVYSILCSAYDGSGVVSLYSQSSGSNDSGPTAIAVDGAGGYLYWNEFNNTASLNTIQKAQISGDVLSPSMLYNNLPYYYTYSICADSSSSTLYFSINWYYGNGISLGGGNQGALYSGMGGTVNSHSVLSEGTGPAGVNAVPYRDIAVDSQGGYVYYVMEDASKSYIYRTPYDFSSTEVHVEAEPEFKINKIAIDTVERKIYWTSDNSIYRAELDSQNSGVELFVETDSVVTGIFVD